MLHYQRLILPIFLLAITISSLVNGTALNLRKGSDQIDPTPKPIVPAIIEISYVDHRNHSTRTIRIPGLFGTSSVRKSINGEVVHIRSMLGENHGCGEILRWNIPEDKPWIALVERGQCSFKQKINNLYANYSASAVVIYDDRDEELFIINHDPVPIVTTLIARRDGLFIADLFDHGIVISMHITSESIIIEEKEEQEREAEEIATSSARRGHLVLAASVIILLSVGVFFLVLLIHAVKVVISTKKSKGMRRRKDILDNAAWPPLNT